MTSIITTEQGIIIVDESQLLNKEWAYLQYYGTVGGLRIIVERYDSTREYITKKKVIATVGFQLEDIMTVGSTVTFKIDTRDFLAHYEIVEIKDTKALLKQTAGFIDSCDGTWRDLHELQFVK